MSRLLVRAAALWIRQHRPDPDDLYATTENGFLIEAERAYFEAFGEYAKELRKRADKPLPLREWGVYQLIDPSGRVLYVGMTGLPQSRVRAHLREFGNRVERVLWEPVATRRDAYDLETRRIAELQPPMNIAKVPE